MQFGLDLLGLAKYSAIALKAFPKDFALGCFSSTFGDSRKAVEAIIKTKRCKAVRVQLMWKDNHSYSTKDFPAIIAEAKKWIPLTKKYSYIRWYFSGACEHNLNEKDATALVRALEDVFVHPLGIVNTPMPGKGSDISTGIYQYNERHGSDAVPAKNNYMFSFDGSSCVDSDVTAIKAKMDTATNEAEIFFFWVPQFNCRRAVNDNTPLPNRTFRPTVDLIKSVAYLATDRGAVKLPNKWLLKSHAEETTDSRSNKPVFIIPLKTKEIVLKSGTKTVATCPYYGPYVDGRWRYYCPVYGYQISAKYGVIDVWANNKKIGTCNVAFRQGGFR